MLLLLAFFGVLYAATLDSYGMFMWDEAEYASLGRSVMRGGRLHDQRGPQLPAGSVVLFNDRQFATLLIRSDWLRKRF